MSLNNFFEKYICCQRQSFRDTSAPVSPTQNLQNKFPCSRAVTYKSMNNMFHIRKHIFASYVPLKYSKCI